MATYSIMFISVGIPSGTLYTRSSNKIKPNSTLLIIYKVLVRDLYLYLWSRRKVPSTAGLGNNKEGGTKSINYKT